MFRLKMCDVVDSDANMFVKIKYHFVEDVYQT